MIPLNRSSIRLILTLLLAVPGITSATGAEVVIDAGEQWRYLKGSAEPSPAWQALDYDDSNWSVGPGGFGYSSDIAYATTLGDMYRGYAAFYLRKSFQLQDPASAGLTLIVD